LMLISVAGERFGTLLFIIFIIYIAFTLLKKFGVLDFKWSEIKKNKHMNTIDLDKQKAMAAVKKRAFGIVLGVIIIWLFFASIAIIEAGETGVYSLFGKVKDTELSSGFHVINPLAKVTPMTIRTEEYTMSIISDEGRRQGVDSIVALTSEGLEVELDMTVLYHLEEDRAADVYKNVGLNYEEKIIRPDIRSTIREVIAKYNSKDIYSVKREEATQQIKDSLQASFEVRGIVVEEVLLRNVKLPANLAQAIQEKLQAEQEAQKYDFLLIKEAKEKERKVIEAEGQRDAQTIINQSLTPNYLYYLYIRELKDREGTIYIPTNPETGLPMFRNLGS